MAETRPNRTLGPGDGDFWAGCAAEELRIQLCTACEKHGWPVVAACEHCGSPKLAWQTMSGIGNVVGWRSFVQDYHRGLMLVPYNTIMVELDEGPIFMSNPADFVYADMSYIMPVEI
jgi:uncharacterized OB-fold protein